MPSPSLLRRLKERKLVQWALAYLAGAFVVVQAVEVMAEPWGISPALQRAVHILLVIGLFITLVLAWYHGEKGRQRVSGPELLMVAALLVVAGVSLSVLGRSGDRGSLPTSREGDDRPGIAVLACDNISPDPEDAYYAEGLHEEILLRLQKISSLFSVGRASVLWYRDNPAPLTEIAAELRVDFIGECSVRKDEHRIRLTFQLLDGRTGEQLWAEHHDRDLTTRNLFDIESEVALQVARSVGAVLTPVEVAQVEAESTEDLTAYEFYLLARTFIERRYAEGWDVVERGIELYQRAVQADSGFVLAYANLANAYVLSHAWGPGGRTEHENAYRLARDAATKALSLDSLSAEAHMAWGAVLMHADHDLAGAEAEFRRALELDPGCSWAANWMDDLLCVAGRYQEAVEFSLLALELEPKDPVSRSNYASSLWGAGRLGEAAAQFSLVGGGEHLEYVARMYSHLPEGWVAAHPGWFTVMYVLEDMGWSYEDAFEKLMENLAVGGASPAELRAYQSEWGGLDWRSLWQIALDPSRGIPRAQYRAIAHTRLGQPEEAVVELRRAWEAGEPGLLWIHGNPFFRKLEGFGPYEEFMADLGLRRSRVTPPPQKAAQPERP